MILAGTVAIVVGGGTGIGRAPAALFTAEGARGGIFARACLYLASQTARHVTGSVLAVDGGWTAS